ncbi:hypothetical protein ES703_61807 [subsurface metagenome]
MDYQGFSFKAGPHFFFNPHNHRLFNRSWYSTRHLATNRLDGCLPSFNSLSRASTLVSLVKALSPVGSRNALRLTYPLTREQTLDPRRVTSPESVST